MLDKSSDKTNLRFYEVVLLMHPDSSEDEQKKLFQKNQKIIQESGGEVNHVDTWGKRKLGNSIGKVKKAVYFHSTFKADPTIISEIERTMNLNDKVLRYLHTKLDDDIDLSKYLENYKLSLNEALNREKESKIPKKRMR